MADPAHLEIAKKGAKAIALWRLSHHGEGMDLFEADLSGAILIEADLIGAILMVADLSGANLSGANLSRANLFSANLTRADLKGAEFFRADFMGADLTGADLSGARLMGANLTLANLTGADLTRAKCFATVFGNCDLSRCQGLEAVEHDGPSTIGIDTLLRTARAGGGSPWRHRCGPSSWGRGSPGNSWTWSRSSSGKSATTPALSPTEGWTTSSPKSCMRT